MESVIKEKCYLRHINHFLLLTQFLMTSASILTERFMAAGNKSAWRKLECTSLWLGRHKTFSKLLCKIYLFWILPKGSCSMPAWHSTKLNWTADQILKHLIKQQQRRLWTHCGLTSLCWIRCCWQWGRLSLGARLICGGGSSPGGLSPHAQG